MRFQLSQLGRHGVHHRVVIGALTLVELFQLILDVARVLAG